MVYITDTGFEAKDINPFTGEKYTDDWIVFALTDSKEYKIMNGSSHSNVYSLKISKNCDKWELNLMDFIGYENSYCKNIILSVGEQDLEKAKETYSNHHYNEAFLRENEPKVLVHSTTRENWEKIRTDGCLKCWNILRSEHYNCEEEPIGRLLGDPKDYSDYIMFSGGTVSSEIVVLSKQNNEIIMDEQMKYKPGARLYFDIKKIAEDGLLVRDGCHLKVKNTLFLDKYLIWTATWESVNLKNQYSTPKEFTKISNEMFNSLFGENIS
ncbi:MAG: hypothetical protein RSA29_12270 [Clostridium sp.]|uniref:hypothetical protein n=1 Tax=Clostridium sp. TaxID=1506 RepID=UPI0030547111